MWQFIISGYVPGTNIQITFNLLLTLLLMFLAAVLGWNELRRRTNMQQEIIKLAAKVRRLREISL